MFFNRRTLAANSQSAGGAAKSQASTLRFERLEPRALLSASSSGEKFHGDLPPALAFDPFTQPAWLQVEPVADVSTHIASSASRLPHHDVAAETLVIWVIRREPASLVAARAAYAHPASLESSPATAASSLTHSVSSRRAQAPLPVGSEQAAAPIAENPAGGPLGQVVHAVSASAALAASATTASPAGFAPTTVPDAAPTSPAESGDQPATLAATHVAASASSDWNEPSADRLAPRPGTSAPRTLADAEPPSQLAWETQRQAVEQVLERIETGAFAADRVVRAPHGEANETAIDDVPPADDMILLTGSSASAGELAPLDAMFADYRSARPDWALAAPMAFDVDQPAGPTASAENAAGRRGRPEVEASPAAQGSRRGVAAVGAVAAAALAIEAYRIRSRRRRDALALAAQ